ncbi:MAG TPA: hypothetical protein VHJ17_09720 [Thermomonospora sp.]|nr:hypothetical protein [Thermomonospora sp.]
MLTRDAVYVVRMSERGGPDPAQRVEGRDRIVEAFRTLDALLSFEEYANPVTICLAFPAVPGLTVTAVR